jgi:hypothetical protein
MRNVEIFDGEMSVDFPKFIKGIPIETSYQGAAMMVHTVLSLLNPIWFGAFPVCPDFHGAVLLLDLMLDFQFVGMK